MCGRDGLVARLVAVFIRLLAHIAPDRSFRRPRLHRHSWRRRSRHALALALVVVIVAIVAGDLSDVALLNALIIT